MTQDIGFVREITPCPRSGKITFKQIGAIRQITTNIACDNEELLLARKPEPTGDLDNWENPIYALREPTYDPADYYSAYWGGSYDVVKGESLGPNPLGDWNEQFVDPQPPDNYDDEADGWGGSAEAKDGYRGVSSGDDGGKPCVTVYSASGGVYRFSYYQGSTPIYEWFWKPRTAYAISYLSRAEAGDRLVFYFEWLSSHNSWYDVEANVKILGWRDGWMSNDVKEYATLSDRHTSWKSEIIEIDVDPSYRDIAIAFYATGSDNGDYQQFTKFRNVHCWRA